MMGKLSNKILSFLMLIVVSGAMIGINVCQFHCSPCGEKYVFVNVIPQKTVCFCKEKTNSCCKKAEAKMGCTRCAHGNATTCRHHHTGFRHTFYKVNTTFQTERIVVVQVAAIIPEEMVFGEPESELYARFITKIQNDFSSKAPPLEWLCTYRC